MTGVAVAAEDTKEKGIQSPTPPKPIRAARSVHLAYPAPESVLFYNEVAVEQSQKGSYFSVCGFGHGYFGIQERHNDKVVIFSIWDSNEHNNPNLVEQEKRVKVLYAGEDVHIRRFGGEGTGAKSLFKYDWKLSERYKFLVSARVVGERTVYAAYFYINEKQQWKHLATFSTLSKGNYLKEHYSFVEDFRRDFESAKQVRKARFENGWVKTLQGQWLPLTKVRFTADSTQSMNINAGVVEDGFFLQTGGETKNQTPLWSYMERLPQGLSLPEDIKK